MSLVGQLVGGQFEFVETYHLTHPRLTGGRRVRVNVNPWRHRRIRVSCYHPLRAVVHVPSLPQKSKVNLMFLSVYSRPNICGVTFVVERL